MKKFVSLLLVLSFILCTLPATAVSAESDGSVVFSWEPVSLSNETAVFDLCIHPGDYDVTQISGFVHFSDDMELQSYDFLYNEGMCMTSPTIDVRPFQIIWIHGTKGLPSKVVPIMRLIFAIPEGDTSFELSFELDPDNPIGTVAGDEVFDVALPEQTEFDYSDFYTPPCNTNVGDPNGDGKVNLGDASLLMKYLAKWTSASPDLIQSDTNNDSKVNLGDVSLLMKYLAKWSSARLGHNDTVEVLTAATCQTEGRSKLTCRNCNGSVEVTTNKISCSYKKTTVTAATCATDGTDKYTCTMCNDSYTKTVKATGKHQYSGGKCTVCGKADPNAKTPMQKFCDWMVKNGEYSDGAYTRSTTVEGIFTSVTYVPAEKELIIGSLYETQGFVFAGIVNIPTGGASKYTFALSAFGASDGVDYFTGWEEMSAKEFSGKSILEYDEAYSDVLESYDSTIEELGWGMCATALTGAEKIFKSSGSGLTLESLGFTANW